MEFSLKEEMSRTLAGTEAWFDFYIQPYVDERTTPIENSKVEWTERISKPKHVAKIIIPMQDFGSVAQGQFCENLSFSPWHCSPEHIPFGLVFRARKVAYARISKLRHELYGVPQVKPTGDEVSTTEKKGAR